jgi:hypothetical protein
MGRYVHLGVFFFLGIGIILGGSYVVSKDLFIASLLLGLGASLIAGAFSSAVILSFIHSAVSNNLSPNIEKLGLTDTHLDLNRVSAIEFRRLIRQAKSIEMMFNTGRYVFEAYRHDIEAAINSGCRLHVVLSDPLNKHFEDEQLSYGLSSGSRTGSEFTGEIRHTINDLTDINLRRTNNVSRIEVKVAPCIMMGSYVFIDHKFLRYVPYQMYKSSSEVPVFDIRQTGGEDNIYDSYVSVYKEVWALGRTILSSNHGARPNRDETNKALSHPE